MGFSAFIAVIGMCGGRRYVIAEILGFLSAVGANSVHKRNSAIRAITFAVMLIRKGIFCSAAIAIPADFISFIAAALAFYLVFINLRFIAKFVIVATAFRAAIIHIEFMAAFITISAGFNLMNDGFRFQNHFFWEIGAVVVTAINAKMINGMVGFSAIIAIIGYGIVRMYFIAEIGRFLSAVGANSVHKGNSAIRAIAFPVIFKGGGIQRSTISAMSAGFINLTAAIRTYYFIFIDFRCKAAK